MDTTKIVEKIKYGNVELKMKTTTLQAKSVDPSVDEQFVFPDSEYGGLSSVTVTGVTNSIDKNIIPGNIRKGKVILGVEGDMEPDKPDQSKTIKPTKKEQEVHADRGYELLSVTVEGVTSDVDENIQPDNIRYGVEILGVVGSMEQKEDLDAELNEQDALLSSLKIQVDNLDEMNLATKTVNKNGTYNASDDGVDGWSSIVVEVGGSQNAEIALPSVFAGATEMYYIAVTDDKILISSNSNVCGLWLYTISTNTMTQVYASGASWKYFQQVTDTKWLICYDYILVYDSTNDNVTQIYNSYSYANVFQQVTDTKWLLCCASSSVQGILLYDSSNDSVTKIWNGGYEWNRCQQVNDYKWLLGASNNSATGVLLYNSTDNSVVKIYNNYSYWEFGKINNEIVLLSPYYGSNTGLFLYDAKDDSVSNIYASGYSWMYYHNVSETKCLIGATNSAQGLLLFDLTTRTVTQLLTTSYNFKHSYRINDDKWLISSANGVWLYKVSDDSIKSLYNAYLWDSYAKIGDTKFLIGSSISSASGILLYDETTDAISRPYTSNYGWIYFQPIGADRCLIGSSYGSATTSSGLLLYDANANTIKKIFSTGFAYDTFVLDGNNCYISSSKKTESKLTLYYNADTNTIELRSFYLGEV